MLFSLARWRPRHLLGAWFAYWTALAAATLTPAIDAIVRMRAPGVKGTVNFSYDDGRLTLDILEGGRPLFSGNASLLWTTLLIAGPPLLLWIGWLLTRPRRAIPAPTDTPALGEGRWQGARPTDAAEESRVRDPREGER